MADTTPTDGQPTPAEQANPVDPKEQDRNMREALVPEIGSDVVQAAGEVAGPPRNTRRWIIVAILVIVALQVAAWFVVPPLPVADATGHVNETFQFPTDAIRANFELPAPHAIYDFTPDSAPSHDLVTFDLTVSSSLFTAWIVMGVIVALAFLLSRGISISPKGRQNVLEYVYEGLANLATSLGGPKARRYVPVFVAFFLFILLSNWSGLFPGVGRTEQLRAPTSDVNITIGLALVAFSMFHIEGIRALGVGGYLGKFFSLRAFREEGIGAGIIALFVGLIEFFLEFIKPVTLAMRLFGNIYGGEVALGVITGLTIAIIPVAMVGLEFLLNFMQA
ncbi:MAG: F0F1 ATP synthase subunit A, partial [Candidatus Limnocylindrales bacterium]